MKIPNDDFIANLTIGSYFTYEDKLYIVIAWPETVAVDMENGRAKRFKITDLVVPVKVKFEITESIAP